MPENLTLPDPDAGLAGSEVVAAERALVASILNDERVLQLVAETVQPAHFYDTRLAAVYGGILAMRAAGEPVNHVTVSGRLDEWQARGITFIDLHAWSDEIATGQNAPWLAEQVRDAGMMREAVAVVGRLQQAQRSRQPATVIEGTIEDLRRVTASAGARREVLSWGDLLAMDTSHDWLVPGLLEQQDRLMLTGIEGLGKSTLLQQIGIAAAAGVHPFNERQPIQPRRVLFVDAENSKRQWARKTHMLNRRLTEHAAMLDANVHVHSDLSLQITNPGSLGELHRLVDDHRPEILVIGPIYRLTGGSMNNDEDVAPVLAALDTFRSRGLALLVEAHAGHAQSSDGSRNLRPRGSSALLGWPEFGFGLRNTRPDDLQECELVSWRGAREERSWPKEIWRNTLSHGLPWRTNESFPTAGGTPWMR